MQVASTKKLPSIFVESRLATSAIPFPFCATSGAAAYRSIIHTLQTETNPLLFHASPSISSKLYNIHRETTLSVKDRKSTRLNSSHDQISYAVFCLKKKK